MRLLALVLAALVIASAVAAPVSLSLQRRPHSLKTSTSPTHVPSYRAGGRVNVKVAAPGGVASSSTSDLMTGGLLTVGAYFATIEVGSPAVKFNVLVDTGSSNLGLGSPLCTTCSTNSSSVYYNPKASSTSAPMACASDACQRCVPLGTSSDDFECVFGPPYCSSVDGNCGFGITYGGGSSALGGSIFTDTVCLGGSCSANVPINVIYTSVVFSESTQPFLGIMGLASDNNACNPTCVETLFDVLVADGHFGGNNLFGMCLTPSNGGALDLGELDASKWMGELQWAPMPVDTWFTITVVDMLVGGTSIGLPPFMYATTNDVIGTFVDSGTSVVLMGPAIYQAVMGTFNSSYCHLPGVCGESSLFTGACYNTSTFEPYMNQYPNVDFSVMGQDSQTFLLTVPPSAYLMDVGGGVTCLGMAGTPSLGVILGDVFMQNYYIAFDRANSRLGFGLVVPESCV